MILMALFALQKRPRPYPPSAEKFVRAYARRWWLVKAKTPSEARVIIERADAGMLKERALVVNCGGHRAETRPPVTYKQLAGFTPPKET